MLDVLAVGAHPDDVELFVGGTLAHFARRGRATGIVHLTRGEAATRGTADTRRAEAEAAANELGARSLTILDLGDGRLQDAPATRDAVIDVLRATRPRLVLAPLPSDDHPDHAAAGAITKAAWYLAGIRRAGTRREGVEPHRAPALWFYPAHELPAPPSFVVEIAPEDLERKRRAIAAYRTQFHDPQSNEPETRISTPEFLEGTLARMRSFGAYAGVQFAEPFVLVNPLCVPDAAALLR